MKSQIATILSIAILGLINTSAMAECGTERTISLANFEVQAKKACQENPTSKTLLIRPYVTAINNFAATKIECTDIAFGSTKTIKLNVEKNPKLTNTIQVLGEIKTDSIIEGASADGMISYRINLKKE
jgi:hypothetical protein